MGFGVWGGGFGIWGLESGVWGLGSGVWGLRCGKPRTCPEGVVASSVVDAKRTSVASPTDVKDAATTAAAPKETVAESPGMRYTCESVKNT